MGGQDGPGLNQPTMVQNEPGLSQPPLDLTVVCNRIDAKNMGIH